MSLCSDRVSFSFSILLYGALTWQTTARRSADPLRSVLGNARTLRRQNLKSCAAEHSQQLAAVSAAQSQWRNGEAALRRPLRRRPKPGLGEFCAAAPGQMSLDGCPVLRSITRQASVTYMYSVVCAAKGSDSRRLRPQEPWARLSSISLPEVGVVPCVP